MVTKDSDNLVCPLCKGPLQYAVEEIVFHAKQIESTTGNLMKRTKKWRVMNNNSRSFILCTKDECDFIMNSSEPEDYTEHFYLFDLINKDDENSFASSVMA